MLPFQHSLKGRIESWVALLLFFVLFRFDFVAAQNGSSFEEVATEAAAARDVDDAPRAIGLYTQALQLNPEWEEGWWSLGLLRYGSRAYPSAIDAFSHLLTLNQQSAPARALRGLCEFETGDYSQSLADIRQGLASGAATDGHNEQILRYREAMLLTRLGNFSDALKAYSPFAERKLSSPELLVGIGLAGLRIRLLPKEVSADQQVLLTEVGDATFKFMGGDQTAAQQAFDDLFQHFPTARNAHFHYGNLLLTFGPEAAAPQFKKELEVAPDSTNALRMLAWSLLNARRPEEALPYARRLAEREPEGAVSQLILGRALLDTGNTPGGIEHLERGLKLQPDDLEIHIALAKGYSRSGRDDDARRERRLCLQMTQKGATRLAFP